MYVLSTCTLCMQVTYTSRVLNTYLPQTRRISMLQAAAARLTVPLQRIRCMTCRYQQHCHLIALCEYKCLLEIELMQTLSKSSQQVA